MLTLINANLLFSYGGTAIVFKTTNRNYAIIFITHNESGIPNFPTYCAVFTGVRFPPYLSKLVNMVPWQKAINIGFTHCCATPARDTALSRWATAWYRSPIWNPRIRRCISSSRPNRVRQPQRNDFAWQQSPIYVEIPNLPAYQRATARRNWTPEEHFLYASSNAGR